MTTLQELSDSYEVDSIVEYVYTSWINGQNKQVQTLLKEIDSLDDYTLNDLVFDLGYYFEEPMPKLMFIDRFLSYKLQ